MGKVSRILWIGFLTALYRILMQMPLLLIPEGDRIAPPPSVFVTKGTLPIAFFVFAFVLYSLVASFSLLFKQVDRRTIMGYSFLICLIWVAYFLEPTGLGSSMIDAIAYPIVDGSAWLVMEGLICWQFKDQMQENVLPKTQEPKPLLRCIGIPCGCFWIGRAFLYLGMHVDSRWADKPLMTMVFLLVTGIVVAACIQWFQEQVKMPKLWQRCLVASGIIFGVNLAFFNGFVLIVYTVDLWDVFIRTFIDILAFSIGSYISRIEVKKGSAVRL